MWCIESCRHKIGILSLISSDLGFTLFLLVSCSAGFPLPYGVCQFHFFVLLLTDQRFKLLELKKNSCCIKSNWTSVNPCVLSHWVNLPRFHCVYVCVWVCVWTFTDFLFFSFRPQTLTLDFSRPALCARTDPPVYSPLHASQGNNDKSGRCCLLTISRDCFSSLVKAMFKSYIYCSICTFFRSVFERGLIVIN